MKIIVIVLNNEIVLVQNAELVSKVSSSDSSVYIGEVAEVKQEMTLDGISDLSKIDEFISQYNEETN